jgi:hypothetical protein
VNEIELRYAIHELLTGAGRPEEVRSVDLVKPKPGEPIALRIYTTDAGDPDGERVYTVIITETDRNLLCVAPITFGNSDLIAYCPEPREGGFVTCPDHRRYEQYVNAMSDDELMS